MVFSGLLFLWYFLPIFLLFYFVAPTQWKNTVALICSCFFYAWGAPEFFLGLFPSLIIDFYLVRLSNLSRGNLQKWLFRINIGLIILLLLVAKYLNFFVDNINQVVNLWGANGIIIKNIILPIGISFITFQRLSYVLDCKAKKTKPLENFQNYALYILLFPQLIAGPIIRFNEIAAQLINRQHQDTIDDKLSGFFRFIIGLAKKVLIADTLGSVADGIFDLAPESLNMATAWLGIIAYAFQIYFDFSGYSDMAIGIARMMGFRFPENFNFPYISQSITEFWRRWHITLGNWMRDYLYIPLGGNRVSTNRMYLNLWIVFLLSGLWHGAAWTFIIWGAFHGLFLILDRLFLLKLLKKWGKFPAILLTYFIVLIGWVFFKANDFPHALGYIQQLFSFNLGGLIYYTSNKFWFFLVIAFCFSFIGIFPKVEDRVVVFFDNTTTLWLLNLKVVITLFLGSYCLLEVMASDFNPFIYFQF